ncbi:linear amide C-N hydrolase [Bacillus sp. AGMB 02131]|uniref:Linear amide C-N hydrolase n=1 Tax=Peribacillus faecalis TaxID=2772559 RepID=A0A927HCS4_9BACI|nr:C45 family peptidase [Peribacillus faecalis]MBD3109821.1 linear amide C-N hydrolase [Peribacillus faecalis]
MTVSSREKTLTSIEELGDSKLYTMTYYADYHLDSLLERGVKSDSDFYHLVSENIAGATVQGNFEGIGCSAFTAITEDGDHVYGRNFDYLMDMGIVVIKTKPKEGYASTGIANLGFVDVGQNDVSKENYRLLAAPYLCMDGMNEKGLAISVLSLDGIPTRQNTGKTKINTVIAIRMVLDKASTVDEAIKMLSQYDMQSCGDTKSYHFLLHDRTGVSKLIEYVNGEMIVNTTNIATNFYVSPIQNGLGHGYDRYDILQQTWNASGGILSEKDCMTLLQKVAQEPGVSLTSETQWSVVYNLDKQKAKVAVRRNYNKWFDI